MPFIWTRLKEDENTCNSCLKTTSDIGKFGRMHVIWKDNSQYRVFTNLWRSFAQGIINKKDLIDKYIYIDVNKYNCKTTQALDSLHLHSSNNNSNINMQNAYLVAMLLNTIWHATEDS